MNPPPPDPYKALGVDKSADVTTIKSAYRKLVLKCHPDKVQDPTLKAAKQDEFQRVQQAYEVLVDETKRKEYDLDAKMRRMRAEAARNVSRQPPTPRTSPKDYAGFNVRTAEPPPSFKPGPPPSPYSPVYTASSPLHSHSWDRDMPYRTKAMYDDGHRARRTASYEKPREAPKEERRRQREEDDEWVREKEQREKEQREKEREREKKSRSDREKEEKREKQKREMDRRDRERDRARRQDQQEKTRSRKAAYVEPYDESDDERRAYNKKKSTMSGAGAGSGSSGSSKKHAETPRRDRSARRDDEPRTELHTEPLPDNIQDKMKRAADYMVERRGSKNNMPTAHFTEGVAYNPHFPDPEVAWHVAGSSPRPRRPSQDEKKFRSRADEADDDVERFMGTPERRPPRLNKCYSSPTGAIHIPNSSAPRAPLSRAATMDYSRTMPQVPSAPPETGRGKSDRRRRGSFDAANEDMHPRRSSTNPRVLHYPVDETTPIPRTGKSSYYNHGDDYFQPPSRTKTMPFPSGQIYEAKRYSDNDIVYSTVNHSADHYSSSHPPYVRAYD